MSKMSTGLVMSQTKNAATGGKSFSKNNLLKNSTMFSIQKPTKAYIGISQSKSSSDVNLISGNISSSIVNTTSSSAFAKAAQHLLIEQDNHEQTSKSSNNLNNKYFSKIPKSVSTSGIKQNFMESNDYNCAHQQLSQKQLTNQKNQSTTMSSSLVETMTPQTQIASSLNNTNSTSSKIRLPSFKKLRNKLSMRKSHSTTANLSEISKLKISTSNTSNNINNVLIPSNSINNISEHDSQSNKCGNIKTNRNIKQNLLYRDELDRVNDGINYTDLNHRFENNDQIANTKALNKHLNGNVITTVTTEEVDEMHLYNNNYHHMPHHPYYQNFNDNCFGAIQEEKMPSGLIEDQCQNGNRNSSNSNYLKIQNELIHHPSSSSSNSSLNNNNNNNNNRTVMNNNNNNNNNKNFNYGSSVSNTTTGTTATSSSLNSDLTSTSTSSPQTNQTDYYTPQQEHHSNPSTNGSSHKNPSKTALGDTPTKNSPSRGIGGFFSTLSSTFSLSNNSNSNVKMRQNKLKNKTEFQKRISLPANYNNHVTGTAHPVENDELIINNINYYKNNNTSPLIEDDESNNQNQGTDNTNDLIYNPKFEKQVLNNNLNVRNNLHSSQQAIPSSNMKPSYTSNYHLNYYTKNSGAKNQMNRINNSLSINQLNSHVTGQMQSYQSLSQIAMNGEMKKNPANILLMKPLNRNSRRASMSELGYGKIESYMKLDKLGEGTYATVFKGQSTINGSYVALKEIRLEHEEGAPCTAIREASLLKQLKHANIVTLHDIIYTNKSLTLVFEYLEKDLKQYMDDCNNIMSTKNVKLFLFQLLRGLAYCHARQILHRDLKPQNLLINQKGELKLADFGLARAKSIPTKTYSNEVVTLWYRPPDVLLGSTDYSTHIDMWGVGCIFYEMICGKPLFPGTKVEDELYLIFKTLGCPDESSFPGVTSNSEFLALNLPKFPPFDPDNIAHLAPRLEPDGVSLLSSYLKFDPKLRASATDSLRHKYFVSFLPQSVYSLGNDQSIFEEISVTLSKDPGIKLLNNPGIRNSNSGFYKF